MALQNSSVDISQYTLDVAAVAQIFGYNEDYVRRMARNKRLPSIRRGREYRFRRSDVDKVILGASENAPTIDLSDL